MTFSRRTFLRSATVAGAAAGGSLLFANATNFGGRSAATMGSSGAPIGSTDVANFITSTGIVPNTAAQLPGGERFMSLAFPSSQGSAVISYTLADGTTTDVHAEPSSHGPDHMPPGRFSEPIPVPADATTAALSSDVPDARARLHVLQAQAGQEKAIIDGGLTPYALPFDPARVQELAQMGAQGSSTLLDVLRQVGLANPQVPSVPGTPGAGSGANVIDGLRVVSRAEWGCDESVTTWGPSFSPAQLITVHHSAIVTSGLTDYSAAVRGIHSYHAVTQGWGDIGYQLLIDPNGTVYQGRTTGLPGQAVFQAGSVGLKPHVVTGGHVYDANDRNIGICLMGDFSSSRPTQAATNALTTVTRHLCNGLNLDPRSQVVYSNSFGGARTTKPAICGHRDWADVSRYTSCPGDMAYPLLETVRQSV
ncbi:peptidoglycan recognition protein family protein [Corynebacterium falsenii]|uniref:peptidoglycan recognition protein family protein n=1 Tax=Corynebacterium falsenii TaxID=108486 RepID=UPI003FD142AD